MKIISANIQKSTNINDMTLYNTQESVLETMRNRMNKNRVFYTLWIPAKRKWESRPVKLNSCERMSHEENKEELVSTFYQKGYIQDRSVETNNKRCQSFLHVIRICNKQYTTSHFKAKIHRCPTF